MEMTEINDAAVARKRRKAIMNSQRSDSEACAAPVTTSSATMEEEEESLEEKPPSRQPTQTDMPVKKRKVEDPTESDASAARKKSQIRYDPEVPMSKEQLAAWRREARRVRNRESAAASRQRIRNRIVELETEVGEWKEKYTQAMGRLQQLIGSSGENSGKSET